MLYNIFLIICVLCSQVLSKRAPARSSSGTDTLAAYSRIVQIEKRPKDIVRRLQIAKDKMLLSVFKRDVESYTEYDTRELVQIFKHGKLPTYRPYSTILITDYERFFRMRAMSARGFVLKKSNYHPKTLKEMDWSSITRKSVENIDDIIYYFDDKK